MIRLVLIVAIVLLSSAAASAAEEIRTTSFQVEQSPETSTPIYATCVAFSPDGTLLALARGDCKVEVRSVGDYKLVATLERQPPINGAEPFDGQMPIIDLAFSPDGKTVAAPGGLVGLIAWSTKTWQQVIVDDPLLAEQADYAGKSWSSRIDFSSDGKKVFVNSIGGGTGLYIYDFPALLEGKLKVWHPGKASVGNEIATSPVDDLLVIAGLEKLQFFSGARSDQETLQNVYLEEKLSYWPAAPQFSANGQFLVAQVGTEKGGFVQLFTSQGLAKSIPARMEYVGDLAISPDGSQVAVCGSRKSKRVYKRGSRDTYHVQNESSVLRLFIRRADGTYIEKELSGHDGTVNNVLFSPDGRYLVSSSTDGMVIVWNVGEASDSLAGGP